MKKHSTKTSFIISLILFCVSLSLLIFFSIVITKNNDEIKTKEIEWRKETDRRNELRTLDSSIKAMAQERADLETHFAQSSDVVPFLNTLESLASRVGALAAVTSVSISDDHSGLLVGLSASGSFASLYKFLMLLENSPYELEFNSMDLKKVGGSDSNIPPWNVTLSLKLLSFAS